MNSRRTLAALALLVSVAVGGEPTAVGAGTAWIPVSTPDSPAAWCPHPDAMPDDLRAVRPIGDPFGPDPARRLPIRLFDEQPKTLIICHGHWVVGGGNSELSKMIADYCKRAGIVSGLTCEMASETERAPGGKPGLSSQRGHAGAETWGKAVAPRVQAAKQRGTGPVITLTVLPLWAFGYAEESKAIIANPKDHQPINVCADGLARYALILRTAGADAVILTNNPCCGVRYGNGKPDQQGVPPPPPANQRSLTPDRWEWLPFAELERRALDGVFWGPNGEAIAKDRPYLWSGDAIHPKGSLKRALCYRLLAYLLRMDGVTVPQWLEEAYAKSLLG